MEIRVDKSILRLLNQVFELERKIAPLQDNEKALRQVRRMKELFEEDFYLSYEDPTGQAFNETRTDVESHLAGSTVENLVIVETLKPIIRASYGPSTTIVQKGIVIAGPRTEPK